MSESQLTLVEIGITSSSVGLVFMFFYWPPKIRNRIYPLFIFIGGCSSLFFAFSSLIFLIQYKFLGELYTDLLTNLGFGFLLASIVAVIGLVGWILLKLIRVQVRVGIRGI